MIARLAIVTLLLATSGAARLPGLTIADVYRQHADLDGQAIKVSGIVETCRPLGCTLRDSKSATARSLSLGASSAFDAAIRSRLGLPVVIEARLDARCLHGRADQGRALEGKHAAFVCLDRAPELADPRLVSPR